MNGVIIQILKKDCRFLFISFATFLLSISVCVAHHEPVHEEIAKKAVLSSDGLTRFANETLGSDTAPLWFPPYEFPISVPQPPIFWVGKGAYNQDYWPRWGNHFYTIKPVRTPGLAPGLTDAAGRFFILNTVNSFTWATLPDQPTPIWWFPFPLSLPPPPPPKNFDNWGKAREYQYAALTSSTKLTRDENMAHMFYSLGHIIHLNQDLSQPDHTRDDAHPIASHAFIENHGDSYKSNPQWFATQPRGWAYWRDQAHFTKLLDFWDRDRYKNNSASALVAEATGAPDQKLGLAEFSNGNFLGEDASYVEFYRSTKNRHYFPFPSLANTDQPQLKSGGWATYLDTTTLADGTQGPRAYLEKIGAGQRVKHHSAIKFFAAMNMGKMGTLPGPAAVTINDPRVLQDYHSILIPKAIEYSAGILDYFFRGQLEVVDVVWDDQLTPPQYTITIRNKSGQELSGGHFMVLTDEENGDRTVLTTSPGVSLTETVADNATWQFNFPSAEATAPTKCILVYRGTIGLTGGNPSDPVDADIAMAVKKFTLGCPAAELVSINETITFSAIAGCPQQSVPPPISNEFSDLRAFNEVINLSAAFPVLQMWDGITCPVDSSAPDREYTGGHLEFGPYPFDANVYAATPILIDDYFTAKLDHLSNPAIYTSPEAPATIPDGTPLFSVAAGHTIIIQAYESWGAWCFISGKLGVSPDGCPPPPYQPPP